jgi:hypothetical protein
MSKIRDVHAIVRQLNKALTLLVEWKKKDGDLDGRLDHLINETKEVMSKPMLLMVTMSDENSVPFHTQWVIANPVDIWECIEDTFESFKTKAEAMEKLHEIEASDNGPTGDTPQ